MRTKNKKWTVPILAIVPVLALAAFLAVGFLTANNAQAAIDTTKGECGFTYDGNDSAPVPTLANGGCTVAGDSVTIKIENGTTPTGIDPDDGFAVFITGGTKYPDVVLAPGKTGVDRHDITVKRASTSFQVMTPGTDETITVTRSMAKDSKVVVAIYDDANDSLADLTSSSTVLPSGFDTLEITFLGAPTVGIDGTDPGSGVNDANQCLVGPDGVDDTEATVIIDANTCSNDDVYYAAESRSKLISDTDGIPADSIEPVHKLSLGGKPVNHTITGDQDSVTITAVLRDAAGNALVNQDVEFAPSSVPDGLVGTRVVTVQTTVARADQVSGQNSIDGVEDGYAIVQRTFSSLPDDVGFKITVEVTAGGANIGSIIIARSGDLDSVTAEACVIVMGDDDDDMDGCMSDYQPKNLYEVGGDVIIHSAAADDLGNTVAINAANWSLEAGTAETWWNTLGCPQMNAAVMPMDDEPAVGPDDMTSPYCKMYDGLSDEAEAVVDRAFSAYGDADDVVDASVVSFSSAGVATFRINANAPGGNYVFIVEGKTGSDDTERTAADAVYITVSGELAKYIVSGHSRILGGGIQTYTVTAADANGNPAALKDDQLTDSTVNATNDVHLVSVFLDGDTNMVRALGLDSENKLDLTVNAEATFRIRANRGASGDIAITVDGTKDIPMEPESGKIVQLGANMMPMAGDAIAAQTVMEGADVMVSSTLSDSEDDMLTYMVSSDDAMVATAEVDMYGMVTITGVAAGMATITVTGTDSDGGMGTQDIMVTVTAPPMNQAPTAPTVAAVTLMEGGSAMTVDAAFTDPEGGMLTYMVSSDDAMVATATVDDMGMVTITPMGAGPATITVTATDPDMAMATVDIMVTVEASAPVLMAPTNVGALSFLAGQVSVAWQPGQDAFGHLVVLFDSANSVAASMTLGPSADSHTFADVAAGDYSVVVVSFRSGSEYELASGVPVTVR